MDSIRNNSFVRYGLMAGFFGTAAYVAPMLFDAIRSGTSVGWFEQATLVLAMVMTFASLRIEDMVLRKRIVTWVVRLFAVGVGFTLGFTVPSIVFLVFALAYGSIEWPHRSAQEAVAY